MEKQTFKFSHASTDFYFDASFKELKDIVSQENAVIITDEHLYELHTSKFKGWDTIVLRAGEAYKVQSTIDSIIEQLIDLEADRKTVLIGVGGGVITDITGYVASVYMRGIAFGFVPTSLLAMVDASIGGKNGIDVGVYKNIVGIIRQPNFLLYDVSLLKTLPDSEWSNGFAEIIKHACIKDAEMFGLLEKYNLPKMQRNKGLLAELIRNNAMIKIKVVINDEFEKGERRLLNYGHTLGHALENQYALSHGQAVAIGMAYASKISELLVGFTGKDAVINVLEQYGLPSDISFQKSKVLKMLKMDKKRERSEINYILLEKTGKGIVLPIPLDDLENILLSLK